MKKNIFKSLIISTIIGTSSPSFADMLKIKENAPEEYTVKKGDTLWDISSKYLNSPWRWPELWQINDFINNPHLIYPGDTINIIINKNGEKEIVINNNKKPMRKIVLSPNYKTKKENIYINSIDFSEIKTLTNGLVSYTNEELNGYGIVLGNNNTESFYSKSDIIYIKNKTPLESGDVINFYKLPIQITENAKLIKYSGHGQVLNSFDNNTYSVHINSSVDMIEPSDLIKHENKNYEYGFNFNNSNDVKFDKTKIVYSFEQKTFLGKGNVFLIEKGTNDNVEIGQVFKIENIGKNTENGKIPNETIGYAVVFNVNKNFSFLQIAFSKVPINPEKVQIKKINGDK